jgi:hypothetical protein
VYPKEDSFNTIKMFFLGKLKRNDVLVFLITISVLVLVFNYNIVYNLNFCEIKTREKEIKVDEKFLDKKSDVILNIKTISHTTKFQNLEHKIEISQKRHSLISIGISTIKRHNSSYLNETLDSLFYSMNAEEKKIALVIVLIAEVRLNIQGTENYMRITSR